jgi:hypothetical protein
MLPPPSSSGLGYLVLSQETGVRFPVGVLNDSPGCSWDHPSGTFGTVAMAAA